MLQKKIVRLITFTDTFPRPHGPLTPTIPIFYQLESLRLSDIFELQTAKFVYNCANLLAPNQFSNFYTFTNSKYNTAASRKELLKVPRARTTNYGLKSIRNIGSRIWNGMPIDSRKQNNIKSFTKKLKVNILSSYNER